VLQAHLLLGEVLRMLQLLLQLLGLPFLLLLLLPGHCCQDVWQVLEQALLLHLRAHLSSKWQAVLLLLLV
jgi:hypothetical protein